MVLSRWFIILCIVSSYFWWVENRLIARTYETIEIHQLQELVQKIDSNGDQKPLIIFDVDETVLRPSTYLGTSNSFWDMVTYYKNKYTTDKQVFDAARKDYLTIQSVIDMVLMEENTACIIRSLEKKHHVLAETSRGVMFSDITRKQLRPFGIRFDRDHYFGRKKKRAFYFDTQGNILAKNKIKDENAVCCYDHGIIFIDNGGKKGKELVAFLQLVHEHPQKIVFIDDKKEYVDNVGALVHELGIDYCGVWYHRMEDIRNKA
jgi:hypothetical protein